MNLPLWLVYPPTSCLPFTFTAVLLHVKFFLHIAWKRLCDAPFTPTWRMRADLTYFLVLHNRSFPCHFLVWIALVLDLLDAMDMLRKGPNTVLHCQGELGGRFRFLWSPIYKVQNIEIFCPCGFYICYMKELKYVIKKGHWKHKARFYAAPNPNSANIPYGLSSLKNMWDENCTFFR